MKVTAVQYIAVCASCFICTAAFKQSRLPLMQQQRLLQEESQIESFDPISFSDVNKSPSLTPSEFLIPVALLTLLPSDAAFADASQYGILAGKTASMLHPITNLALFATSLYSAYLGLQWRRLRGIGDELKELTAQMPKLSTGTAKSPVNDMIASVTKEIKMISEAASPETDSTAKLQVLNADLALLKERTTSEIDAKIQELTATRKALIAGNLRDKHWQTGSILLGAGVSVSLLGAFNTYMRAGKLFPGPHLFAGMGVTILWAVAAALVPAMQKGNEAARTAHIGLNVVNILLFAWQVNTGLEIMFKVWEKTPWP